MLFTRPVLKHFSLSLFDWDMSAVNMHFSGIHHGTLRMYGKLVLFFTEQVVTFCEQKLLPLSELAAQLSVDFMVMSGLFFFQN